MLKEKMSHTVTAIQEIIVRVILRLKQLVKTVLSHVTGLQASVTHVRKYSIRYLGWGLLYMGKPFTRIGNWFWKLHRTVLDWNN